MILLNFAHPLTEEQRQQVEALAGMPLERVLDIPVQFDNAQPFPPQLERLLEAIPLAAQEWQAEPVLVNLPAYNYITAMLLAALHGRMGYFPAILRIRPSLAGSTTHFEVAEIINLHSLREENRLKRFGSSQE